MTITFLCPNGHKLNCREELAGKPGKCPKCAAAFTVPQPTAQMANDESRGTEDPFDFTQFEGGRDSRAQPAHQTSAVQTDHTDQAILPAGESEAAAIEFLCPNGHRLHGLTNQVGRPGQCPHCKTRFLIPSPDDVPDEHEPETAGSGADGFFIAVDTGGSKARPGVSSDRPAAPLSATDEFAPPPADAHPLAHLLARLWTFKRQERAIVELHFKDGKILVPQWYSPHWSNQTHGLFADKEASGSHRLTAIAWDTIERVAVRGVDRLPKEMFGDM